MYFKYTKKNFILKIKHNISIRFLPEHGANRSILLKSNTGNKLHYLIVARKK